MYLYVDVWRPRVCVGSVWGRWKRKKVRPRLLFPWVWPAALKETPALIAEIPRLGTILYGEVV